MHRYDSGVFSSEVSNFQKWKRGDLICWWSQFCRMADLFWPPFCFSILKLLRTRILRHSLHFNAFCKIQKKFSQTSEFFTNYRQGPNFCGEPLLQNGCIIWCPQLYFNFKTFKGANSSSFIRFQFILDDSGEVFWDFWDFVQIKEWGPNFLRGTNSGERLIYLVTPSAFQL